MSPKKPNDMSTEGMIITVAFLIFVMCVVGALSTGKGPVEFFFIGISFLFVLSIVGFILAGIGLVLFNAFIKYRSDDGRSFLKIIVEDYGVKKIIAEYALLYSILRKGFIEAKAGFKEQYKMIKADLERDKVETIKARLLKSSTNDAEAASDDKKIDEAAGTGDSAQAGADEGSVDFPKQRDGGAP